MASTSTRDTLQSTALELFTEHGFDAVTVAEIARAAGVSHMTFFRHFPTKESVVVADLFDPVIAGAVAAQPGRLPPLHRAVNGFVAALSLPEARAELGSTAFVRRVRLAASTPSLRGAAWVGSRATEDAVADALRVPGGDDEAARTAAGAVMGASTSILLRWAAGAGGDDAPHPAQALTVGLRSLLGVPA